MLPLANTILRRIGYNCHGCRRIYLSTFFRTLLGIVGSCGLQRIYLNFIRPSYNFFYGFLQRTGAKPWIDHAEIVWRSYRDEVSVAMHRNRTVMAPGRLPYGGRADITSGFVTLVYCTERVQLLVFDRDGTSIL